VTTNEQKASRPFVEVYDNGQPKVKGMLLDGQRDGLWVSFYEDGVRWSEENYSDGKLEGRAINFYPNGLLRFRGQYMNGEKAGLWQFYDQEGKLIKEETF
jgi:antitoxin component YwqK of YwqJK toxin-antitoxin module